MTTVQADKEIIDFAKTKLPTDFPILKMVVDVDLMMNDDGTPGKFVELLRKFAELHRLVEKDEMGYSKMDRLAVKISFVSKKHPIALPKFMDFLGKHDFLKYFDQCFFEQIWTGGNEDIFLYAVQALDPHIFWSQDRQTVEDALDLGIPAVHFIDYPNLSLVFGNVLRVYFDCDSVLFNDKSERVYERYGLKIYRWYEPYKMHTPLGCGPLASFAQALARLSLLSLENVDDHPEIVLGINTVRGQLAATRAQITLLEMGIVPDVFISTCGEAKGPLLEAAYADVFFDDGARHVNSALEHGVFAAHLPWGVKNNKNLVNPDHPEYVDPLTKEEKEFLREAGYRIMSDEEFRQKIAAENGVPSVDTKPLSEEEKELLGL